MSNHEKRVRRKSRKLSEAELEVVEPPKKKGRRQSSTKEKSDIKRPKKLLVSFDISTIGSKVSSRLQGKSLTSSPVSSTSEGKTVSEATVLPKRNMKTRFKNPKFCFSFQSSNKKRTWKGLKQVIQADKNTKWNPDIPTYSAIDAPPPLKPIKKYSDISGLPAKYTDPLTGMHYTNSQEFETIRTLSTSTVQNYLALRGKATIT